MDPDLVTTASVNGTAVTSPLVTNAPSVTIDFSASDPDESPPSALTTEFGVNGGAIAPGTSLTLTNEGSYTIQYLSMDAAGDFGATKTLLVTIDRTAPTIAITSVSPSTLWPPNGKPVNVTVTGTIADNLSGTAAPLSVQVQNEPGYQGGFTLPTSPVVVQPSMTSPQSGAAVAGNFAFTITLEADRAGSDFDGRQYTILVTATDAAGNSGTASTVVTVPHDQGHQSVGLPGGGFGRGIGGDHSPVGLLFRPGLGHPLTFGNGGLSRPGLRHPLVLGNVGRFRPGLGHPLVLGNGHGNGRPLVLGNGHGQGMQFMHGHGHGG